MQMLECIFERVCVALGFVDLVHVGIQCTDHPSMDSIYSRLRCAYFYREEYFVIGSS